MINDNEYMEAGLKFLTEQSYNAFKVDEWKEAILSDGFDINEYEELLEYFSVGAFFNEDGFSASSSPKFLPFLQKEIYRVLSDDKNKGKADIIISSLISGVSSSVSNNLNLNPLIISGFANLVILSVLKIGVDAWCSYYYEKNKDMI